MICKKCNIDKTQDEYQSYVGKTGDTKYRLTCRICRNTDLYERHKDMFKDKASQWRKENKSKHLEGQRKSLRKQRKERPWMICMKNMLYRKKHRLSIYKCGYTYDEFKQYIESKFDDKMSWNNWGDYWDVDHIKPRKLFSFEERVECHSLSNLQPLEKVENRYIKKDKYKQ